METTFYVVGGALTVLALIISFIGMKSEKFPTDAQLRIGIGLFAVVVAVTAVFAVKASQEEALHREEEANVEAAAEEEQATLEDEQLGSEEDDSTGTIAGEDENNTGADGESDGGAPDATAGLAVYTDNGCASCHSLEAADSNGQIGPNLDVELVDKDEEYIETAIVDPDADVVEGFGDGIMPENYGDDIAPDDLADLVAFLYDSTHEASK